MAIHIILIDNINTDIWMNRESSFILKQYSLQLDHVLLQE